MGAAAPYIEMAAGSALSAYFSSSGENRVGFPQGEFAPHMYDTEFRDVYNKLLARAGTPADLGPGPQDLPSFAGGGGLPMPIGMTADVTKYGPSGGGGTGTPGAPPYGGYPPPTPTGPPYPQPTGTPPGTPPINPPPNTGPGTQPPPYPGPGGGTPGTTPVPGGKPKGPPAADMATDLMLGTEGGGPRRLTFGATGKPSPQLGSPLGTGSGGGLDSQAHGAIQLLMQLMEQGQSGQGAR